MFEALASAIEELEVRVDGDALVTACRLLDRLNAKVALAAAELDASRRWELDGATSAAGWLKHRAGMTASAANWTVRTGNLVKQLPVTRQAWLSGGLSTAQVRAVEANVEPRTVELFADHEAEVVPFLAPLSARQTATAMQHWRRRAEALLGGDELGLPHRSLKLSRTFGGHFYLSGSLDPPSGEIVNTALRLAMTRDAEGEPRRTFATQLADAMVDMARFYVDHQHETLGG
ncbi:MAG: 13E12 repeat family protein, partial [Actinobacteria bacterium]|nr:13E12 repeat family protein [Actinomycetota bacterium]